MHTHTHTHTHTQCLGIDRPRNGADFTVQRVVTRANPALRARCVDMKAFTMPGQQSLWGREEQRHIRVSNPSYTTHKHTYTHTHTHTHTAPQVIGQQSLWSEA